MAYAAVCILFEPVSLYALPCMDLALLHLGLCALAYVVFTIIIVGPIYLGLCGL